MSFNEPSQFEFSHNDQEALLAVASASVEAGLSTGRPLCIDVALYSRPLQERRASFVTLHIAGELRGCMGAIKAVEPLVTDVSRNAYAAAFRDPRFSAVTPDEFPRLEYHISVLSEATPISFDSELELIAKIRPGIDGLILSEGTRRGTLLPAVWDGISDPRVFLKHLKKKAGLPEDYWSSSVGVERYTAISIGHE